MKFYAFYRMTGRQIWRLIKTLTQLSHLDVFLRNKHYGNPLLKSLYSIPFIDNIEATRRSSVLPYANGKQNMKVLRIFLYR